ncbi:MAG: hypothetical protein ACLPZM_09475 [Thermoplasmata archaeon]
MQSAPGTPEDTGLWMWIAVTTVVVVALFGLALVIILGINTPG